MASEERTFAEALEDAKGQLEEVNQALADNEAKVTEIYQKETELRQEKLLLRDDRRDLVQKKHQLERIINPSLPGSQSIDIEGQPAKADVEGKGI